MTKFYYLVALVTLLLPASLIAQEKVSAQPVPVNSVSSLSHIFKKYALFSINTAGFAQYVKDAAAGGEIRFNLDLPGYSTFPVSMREHDILSNDYKLVVGGSQGRQEFAKPACMTYAGELVNEANSDVHLTITSDLIYGMFTGSSKSWFIEPLRGFNKQAAEDIYVVYETSDVVPRSNINCGVTEVMTRRITNNSTARIEGTATGTCRMLEVAIASDHYMIDRYGTSTRVQQHNIAVINTMVGLYSNAQIGTQYLEFKINGQYVAAAEANDPYSPANAGTDASALLADFTTWGQAGNFGFTYDLGVVWTTRDISGGVVGVAYVGTICSTFGYQILEDLASMSGAHLGAVAAHETGHNLDCNHDAGAGFIMQSSIGAAAPTDFSATSLSEMDAYITANNSCLGACNAIAPIAQFNATSTGTCTTSGSITFTSYSVGQVTGQSWTFQDGTPATSTSASQAVTFSSTGYKQVALTATNASGSNTITKFIYVGNNTIGTSGCRTTFAGGGGDFGILQAFMVQDVNFTNTPTAGNLYYNNTCTNTTALQPSTTYTVVANLGFVPNGWQGKLQLFIDYNNDGDFADLNEAVYTSPSCTYDEQFTFTTPASITLMDAFLRMRVIALNCSAASTNGCSVPNNVTTADFSIFFSNSVLPVMLKQFDGYYNNGKSELNWQTETEANTDHFIVERSIDGSHFTEIGNVQAKGLTSRSLYNYYQLNDPLLNIQSAKRFFYRLKIVDKDGSYTFSKLVITTRPDGDKVQVIVYPNPVLRNTSLQIMKANNNRSLIEVFNSMGQRVYARRMAASLYNASVEIPSSWSSGVYMIRVSDNKESWSRPVTIK
jgi:PKD repeat protein